MAAIAEGVLRHGWLEEGPSDRTLILEAQSGRPEAAATLIERYYPRIYSFVSHLTYGRANAEDLTQEAFTRALKALGRFNGQYQFEHWLLRIARNICIDEARRNQRRPEPTDPLELSELETVRGGDYVWESVSRQHLASTIQEALAQLPPRQREILILREIEGMSYADIARVVDTNLRGVEATLRRARARFRLEMARVESTEGERAVCRRILRIIANNPSAVGTGETSRHLAQCRDCRTRARSIRSAGKALGLLPPILGTDSWLRHQVESFLRRLGERARSLGEGLRAAPQAMVASPLTPILHATATLVVAAGVAAGSAAANPPDLPISTYGNPPAAQQEAAQPEAEATLVGGLPPSMAGATRGSGQEAATRASASTGQPARQASDYYQQPGLPLELVPTLDPTGTVSGLPSALGLPVDLTAVIEALEEAAEVADTTALEVIETAETVTDDPTSAIPSENERRDIAKVERPQPKKMRPPSRPAAQSQ